MNPLRALAAPVYIPSLIYSIGNGALQPVIVLAALDVGFGDAGSSAVLGVAGVVGVFTAPVRGSFITKVGDRRSLVIASILALVALALSGSALFFGDSAYAKSAFMTGIVALAISLNVWTLARQAYIADTLPGMWRGRGLSMLGGLLRVGVLVGPLLATGLIALWGLGSVFALNAITVATALALIIRYLVPISIDFDESSESSRHSTGQRGSSRQRDTSTREDSEREETVIGFSTGVASASNVQPGHETGISADDHDVSSANSHKEELASTRGEMANAKKRPSTSGKPVGVPRPDLRSTVIAGIGITSLTILRANKNVIIPLWGTALGLSNEVVTLAFASSALIDTIMFYPAGKLADRKGRLWALLPSLIIMSLAIILMVSWSTTAGFFIGSILLGFGNGFGSGILMTLGADLSPSRNRATFLGYWQAIGNTGSAAGPFVVAGLTAILGVSAGLWATAGLGLFGAIWFRTLLPATYRRLGLTLRGMPINFPEGR